MVGSWSLTCGAAAHYPPLVLACPNWMLGPLGLAVLRMKIKTPVDDNKEAGGSVSPSPGKQCIVGFCRNSRRVPVKSANMYQIGKHCAPGCGLPILK